MTKKILKYLIPANNNYKELLKQVRLFNVKNIIITNRINFEVVKNLLKNKKINVFNNFEIIRDKIIIKEQSRVIR